MNTRQQTKLNADLQIVYLNWHNSFRFSSEYQIKQLIVKRYKKQRIKGNIVKYATLETLESAAKIVDRGVLEWEKC